MAVPQSVLLWFDMIFHSFCATEKVPLNIYIYIFAVKVLCCQSPMQYLNQILFTL